MTYYERNLPHWHPPAKNIFLTWRLYGSLPVEVVKNLKTTQYTGEGRRFRDFDSHLDSVRFGPAWLKQRQIAEIVVAKIRHVERLGFCQIHAYVIMPNHVHVLLDPLATLKAITRCIKGTSAREANLLLGRTGEQFWRAESFDHWIRNSAEFERVSKYIECNPVSAGLVNTPSDWPWSSAAR